MKLMPGDERYFSLAIQTVLQHNQHRLYLLTESATREPFLKELSRDILQKAQMFKTITETAVRELEAQPSSAFREGLG